jgi:ketosteroid isomerase-like protein
LRRVTVGRSVQRAMSQKNAEVVRRGFEAFNGRDIDRLLALSDPDAEWLPFRAQLEGTPYRGHEGLRRFLADMEDDWSSFRVDPLEFHDRDERVAVIARVTGRGRGSGVDIEMVGGFVAELRDGRITRLTSHSDPGAALEAVGLS